MKRFFLNGVTTLRSKRVMRAAIAIATGAVFITAAAIARPDPCVDTQYQVLVATVYSKVPDRARYAAEALCKSPANVRKTKPWLVAARHEYASKASAER